MVGVAVFVGVGVIVGVFVGGGTGVNVEDGATVAWAVISATTTSEFVPCGDGLQATNKKNRKSQVYFFIDLHPWMTNELPDRYNGLAVRFV